MTQPHRISDTFPFKSLSLLARPVQAVEELAEYFGSVRLQLAYGQCLGKRSFAVDIVFLELLQEAWVLVESTKAENSFEAASGSRKRTSVSPNKSVAANRARVPTPV
jgi:hypothetical protein